MKKVYVYIAGKVSSDSTFGTSDWRDGFCRELENKTGLQVINLDPTKGGDDFDLDQNNADLIVGRNSFMIKKADVVVVYLSDDISVGGSEEMLIAKYYKKPLIGLAPQGGKFNKGEKELIGRKYLNYIDPYVRISCDYVAGDIDETAKCLKKIVSGELKAPKDLSVFNEAIEYYERNHHSKDILLH